MDKSKQLGEESIKKLLFKFSLPAIVGMLVNALYSIIDRIFVGKGIGDLAMSGVTITFPISTIIMAFGMLVGIGTSALISIRLGQQKKEEAEKILGNALTLIIIVSILVSIIGIIFIDGILKKFGASPEVLPYAKTFITIILFGAVLQNIGFGLNNSIRAEGNPKTAMVTMLIGGILNCILAPIFIFVFHWGMKGTAIATVISQGVNTIWVLSYFLTGKSMLKLRKKNLKLDKEIVKSIFSIGMSPFSMQVAASIVIFLSNKSLVKYGGDLAIGAMGAISGISMLFLMPIFGINQGCQPIIGYNYGAKKYDRVKKALKLAILAATTITTTGFILIEVFPRQLVSIFNSNPKLVSIGVQGMRVYLMMLPIIGFQIVSSNYFQAVGKAKISIFLSLARQVIVLIPLLLILPNILGLKGVWMSGPISDALSSIITAGFLFREMKNLNEQHQEEQLKEYI